MFPLNFDKDKYLILGMNTKFFDEYLTEFTREELLVVIGYLGEEIKYLRADTQSILDFI